MALDATITKSTYRSGSQFSDVDPSHIAPEINPPEITATGNTGAMTIADNGAGGTFTLLGAGHWRYVPLNRTKAITITVTDTLTHVDKALAVTATFPIQPHFGYEIDTPTNSKVVLAKDDTPRFRRIQKKSASWTFSFLNRVLADVSVAKAFEFFHDIDEEFYLIDPELVMQLLVRLDSSIKIKVNGANNFEMSCIVKAYQISAFTVPTAYT